MAAREARGRVSALYAVSSSARYHTIALREIVQEFRYRVDAGNQQMIPGAGTGNVKQMAFGIINLLQIGIVADRLDALLQGNYFVVAGHHDDGPKLQTFGEVHSADRNVPAGGFNVLIENLESKPSRVYGGARTIQLRR
jgi:hypothetical protein